MWSELLLKLKQSVLVESPGYTSLDGWWYLAHCRHQRISPSPSTSSPLSLLLLPSSTSLQASVCRIDRLQLNCFSLYLIGPFLVTWPGWNGLDWSSGWATKLFMDKIRSGELSLSLFRWRREGANLFSLWLSWGYAGFWDQNLFEDLGGLPRKSVGHKIGNIK